MTCATLHAIPLSQTTYTATRKRPSLSPKEAMRIASAQAKHRCQRCDVHVSANEFSRSQQAFHRVFCDRCFDEVFLERRNFEKQVELNKTNEAQDGTVVQSQGERRIAEWLTAHGLAYRYDAKLRIIGEFQISPDFYLPELDLYIEYWGLDTPQYKMSMYKKQMLYQQEGKRLISVYPRDMPDLDTLPTAKLRLFGCMVSASERSEVKHHQEPAPMTNTLSFTAALPPLFSEPQDITNTWGQIHFGTSTTPLHQVRTCENPGFELSYCQPLNNDTWDV